MPVFKTRSRVEILRQMVARVISRSKLVGLTRNSSVFHILASSAGEDAEIYFQLARLRRLFSIDDATGSELDERAAEIQPGTLSRRQAITATTQLVFSRIGTAGTDLIPIGTLAGGTDAQGRINFRTTVADSVTPGNTDSGPVPAVAVIGGVRGNLDVGQVNQMVTRLVNIVAVTNPSRIESGRDRESDDNFRQRIKDFVQSLARGTLRAIEGFARAVTLIDGTAVLFAKVDKPVIPTGIIILYIDDGTGFVETKDDSFVGGISEEDVLIASAAGGETEILSSQKPIKDDAALIFRINDIVRVRGLDWQVDPARGQFELLPGTFPTGLTATDKVAANYRFYTGLIQEVQRVITGDPLAPLTHPGVEAGGITTLVQPAVPIAQTLTANVSVLQGFDLATVNSDIETAIIQYINNLNIGDDVIVSEIIEQAMGVSGVFDFKITNLSGGSPPANQIILANQVARLASSDITLN